MGTIYPVEESVWIESTSLKYISQSIHSQDRNSRSTSEILSTIRTVIRWQSLWASCKGILPYCGLQHNFEILAGCFYDSSFIHEIIRLCSFHKFYYPLSSIIQNFCLNVPTILGVKFIFISVWSDGQILCRTLNLIWVLKGSKNNCSFQISRKKS